MTIPFDLLHDILVPRSGKLFALKKSIHRFRGRRDRNLFIREINCVAELKPHKNIVRYDRYFDHDIFFTFPASLSIFFVQGVAGCWTLLYCHGALHWRNIAWIDSQRGLHILESDSDANAWLSVWT